ncbi:hypothetical protein LTR56_027298 [Elasticomyces elasticus]|nr:hypothetical protein LTR56_027298 [Elasticomyces elasticus]KAK3614830.1 hypothetical protein LTR22_027656 [Elasticomyces elasticus]
MQLSQGRPAVSFLVNAFDIEYGRGLTVRDLEVALIEILAVSRGENRCEFIVLDALDESPDTTDGRRGVFKGLSRVVQHFDSLHLLITSRTNAGIEHFMNSWRAASTHNAVLSVNNDIESVMRHELATSSPFGSLDEASRDIIVCKTSGNAGEMFRWAAMQLLSLQNARSTTHTGILDALEILPSTLDATYERVLANIPTAHLTEMTRILALLTVASRPVALWELAKFHGYKPDFSGSIIAWDDENDVDIAGRQPRNSKDAILRLLLQDQSGLITTEHKVTIFCAQCKAHVKGTYSHCNYDDVDLCTTCHATQERQYDIPHALVLRSTIRIQLDHVSVSHFLTSGPGNTFLGAQGRLLPDRVLNRVDDLGMTVLHSSILGDRSDMVRPCSLKGQTRTSEQGATRT